MALACIFDSQWKYFQLNINYAIMYTVFVYVLLLKGDLLFQEQSVSIENMKHTTQILHVNSSNIFRIAHLSNRNA